MVARPEPICPRPVVGYVAATQGFRCGAFTEKSAARDWLLYGPGHVLDCKKFLTIVHDEDREQTLHSIEEAIRDTSKTVEFHKYKMMEELGIKSIAELVRFAVRNHIVTE